MDLRLTDTVKLSFHWCFGAIQYVIWAAVFPVCLDSCVHTNGLWSFLVWWLQHVYMHARPCMYVLACVCVNSGPPAHFTHRQTSKAVWINPACRSALHAIRNFTSLPLQQHQTYMPIHIEMNRWSFAMHRIAILHWEKIKLQKSRDIFGSVCRWLGCVLSQVKWRCSVSLCECGQSAGIIFFLLKQVNCVSITALLQKPAPFLLD